MAIITAQKDMIISCISYELQSLIEDDQIDTHTELKNLIKMISGNKRVYSESFSHFKQFFHDPKLIKRIWEYGSITVGEARLCMLDYVSDIINQIIAKQSVKLRGIGWNFDKIKQKIESMADHELPMLTYAGSLEHRLFLIGQLTTVIDQNKVVINHRVLKKLMANKHLHDANFQIYHIRSIYKLIKSKHNTQSASQIYQMIHGLSRHQIRGIRMGLNKKQVTLASFSGQHIKIIPILQKEAFKGKSAKEIYDIIVDLTKHQIQGLILGLSLKQVQSATFQPTDLVDIQKINKKYPEISSSDAFQKKKCLDALKRFGVLPVQKEQEHPQNSCDNPQDSLNLII